jgi:hypothetical protein
LREGAKKEMAARINHVRPARELERGFFSSRKRSKVPRPFFDLRSAGALIT